MAALFKCSVFADMIGIGRQRLGKIVLHVRDSPLTGPPLKLLTQQTWWHISS